MTSVRILQGDCRDVLPTLPAESVHCCVTSPPYFGLRSYLPDGVRLKPDLPREVRAAVIAELASLGVFPTSV
jgi:DNA modification methylase